ncbi:DNA primase [Alkalithermobacter thermoalcaliphilus JW-YL-7 = DSM 7308]|uniref:DNA primase n=1 Tax=Alkalithermobacter thermoalcaliphilus JW-YL-7 = DSM 7308 TaxID=1121328 RepID=A0A150FQ50_CLOPD|nr:DNA primase [[Clostridium] paradoxum JW-YL-7 = DSM 7308]SHK62556.1 DNA primase [[Clostridium] paradoxum JW-YL-7 = DSM 7308]
MNDIQDVIQQIKESVDIVDIISSYISISPSGSNYKALCPFHSEKTPSFIISSQKQMYKCFGCGEGGDVIKFVMKMENLDFVEALKFLGQKVGIQINSNNISKIDREKLNKEQKLLQIHAHAARYFFANLMKKDNSGYKYLISRGLDEKTIKYFGLGYASYSWDNLIKYLLNKGYKIEEIVDCGLAIPKKNGKGYIDRFINRVIFPIFNTTGNVIGFGGRVLDNSLPKYLNSPDTQIFNKRFNLYGLNFARKNISDKTLIIVEGYMDVITLFQFGIKNVVASLGTSLTKEQGKLIKKYANKVIIAYDCDEAGVAATIRGMDILKEAGLDVKVLKLDKAKDPDEYIRTYGIEEFKNSIQNCISLYEFKINILRKKYNLDIDDERIKFTKEAALLIKEIKSPIEAEYYINLISKIANITPEAIKKEIYGRYYKNKFVKEKPKTIEKLKVETNTIENAEFQIMKILITRKDLRSVILLKLDIDDFLIDKNKEIVKFIIKNSDLDIISIDKIKHLDIDEKFLNKILDTDISHIDLKCDLNNLLTIFKRGSLKQRVDILCKRQADLEYEKKNNKNIDMSEVDMQLLQIGLDIMKIKKQIDNLI